MIFATLWVGVTVFFFFFGVREDAPQELKVIMTPGLLLIVYALVWLAARAWGSLKTRGQTAG